jgi:hypothetical protein
MTDKYWEQQIRMHEQGKKLRAMTPEERAAFAEQRVAELEARGGKGQARTAAISTQHGWDEGSEYLRVFIGGGELPACVVWADPPAVVSLAATTDAIGSSEVLVGDDTVIVVESSVEGQEQTRYEVQGTEPPGMQLEVAS